MERPECRETRDRFSAYLDGELPEADRRAVDGHLGVCAVCREEYEAYQESIRALQTTGLVEAGEQVVVVAGTGRGADTALVMAGSTTTNLKGAHISRVLCKPL